jgi:hypothetical protein
MRVGPHGLLQTLADGLKLMSKENITPLEADRFIFHLAPLLCFAATFVALAFIPWAPDMQAVNFNVGLVFVLGIGSVGVLGILAAAGRATSGSSSRAMRAGAQIISYSLGDDRADRPGLRRLADFARSSPPRRRGAGSGCPPSLRGLRDLRDRPGRGVQPHAVRLSGSGAGARRGLSHRVQLDGLRDVLPRRVRQHLVVSDLGHGLPRGLDAFHIGNAEGFNRSRT